MGRWWFNILCWLFVFWISRCVFIRWWRYLIKTLRWWKKCQFGWRRGFSNSKKSNIVIGICVGVITVIPNKSGGEPFCVKRSGNIIIGKGEVGGGSLFFEGPAMAGCVGMEVFQLMLDRWVWAESKLATEEMSASEKHIGCEEDARCEYSVHD